MTYCLDSNALIDAWNFWYRQATHPSLWTAFESMAKAGTLKIPEPVYDEIGEQRDALFAWCKEARDDLVHPVTESTEREYGRLVNLYPEMVGSLGMGDNYADLYVVAVARVNDATVVTNEDPGFRRKPNKQVGRARKNYRITNVCREQSVEIVRGYDILSREGWVFQHGA
jgi:predicted nucleic acid-binding protein